MTKRQDISLSQREPSKQPAASTPPFCLLRAEAPMSQQAANYCLVLQPGTTHATETYIGSGASQYPGFECPLQDGCSQIRLVLVSNNRHKFWCMLHPTELESKMALSTGAVKDFSLLQDPDGISHSSICEKYQPHLSLSFFEWLLHQYLCRPSFTICSVTASIAQDFCRHYDNRLWTFNLNIQQVVQKQQLCVRFGYWESMIPGPEQALSNTNCWHNSDSSPTASLPAFPYSIRWFSYYLLSFLPHFFFFLNQLSSFLVVMQNPCLLRLLSLRAQVPRIQT